MKKGKLSDFAVIVILLLLTLVYVVNFKLELHEFGINLYFILCIFILY